MQRHYFLTTLLPQLMIGQVPELASSELDFLLHLNLSPTELKDVQTIRTLGDIDNIRLLLQGEPLTSGGNYTENELEEKLLHQEGLPKYILAFFDLYSSKEERIVHFSKLYHDYFRQEIVVQKHFLCDYLSLERNTRLVLTALRALDEMRDRKLVFQHEDAEDPFVNLLLEQKQTLELPQPYDEIQSLYERHKTHPLELYRAFEEWRFKKVDELTGWHSFHIYKILAYIIQLEICEKWLELDKTQGLQTIQNTFRKVS